MHIELTLVRAKRQKNNSALFAKEQLFARRPLAAALQGKSAKVFDCAHEIST